MYAVHKQAAGNSIAELVSGLTGLTSARGIKALSFGNKRVLVKPCRPPEVTVVYTPTYAAYQNSTTVKHITTAAQGYLDTIESMAGARALIEKSGFDYGELARGGFTQNKDGLWVQKVLNAQATDKERQEMLAGSACTTCW